jgi:hypothetical protein
MMHDWGRDHLTTRQAWFITGLRSLVPASASRIGAPNSTGDRTLRLERDFPEGEPLERTCAGLPLMPALVIHQVPAGAGEFAARSESDRNRFRITL